MRPYSKSWARPRLLTHRIVTGLVWSHEVCSHRWHSVENKSKFLQHLCLTAAPSWISSSVTLFSQSSSSLSLVPPYSPLWAFLAPHTWGSPSFQSWHFLQTVTSSCVIAPIFFFLNKCLLNNYTVPDGNASSRDPSVERKKKVRGGTPAPVECPQITPYSMITKTDLSPVFQTQISSCSLENADSGR